MFIGTNIDGNAENESAAPWNDCVHSWNPFTDPGGAAYLTAAQLSPQGWPLAAAKTVCGMHGYEDGPGWQLSYRGPDASAITFQGCLSLDAPPVQGADGIWRANVTKNGDGVGVLVKPGTSAISLLRPSAAAGKIWDQRFVDLAAKFAVLRFMDMQRTNFSPQQDWTDRPTLDHFPWTGPLGVPLEALIELANSAGRNPWFCVPHLASDDYANRLSALAASALRPELQAYVEYSNELWNFSFSQWKDTGQRAAASALPGLPPPDAGRTDGFGFNRTVAWQGVRAAQMARIAQNAFAAAGRPKDVRPILGGNRVNAWWTGFGQSYAAVILGGKPADYFWGEAVAAYVYLKDDSPAAIPDLDHLFALLLGRVAVCLSGEPGADGLGAHKKQNDGWGIASCCYESGQSLVPGNGTDAVKAAAQTDSRMGRLYIALYQGIDALGYTFANHDSTLGVGRWWPLLPDWKTASAPKFDALMALQNPLPALPPWPAPIPVPPSPTPPPPPAPAATMPVPPEGCGVLTLNGKQKWFTLGDTMPGS